MAVPYNPYTMPAYPVPTPARPWKPRCSRTMFAVMIAVLCAAAATAEPPSYKETVKAWTNARSWLDRDRLPDLDSQASSIALDGVTGASVVLRLNGRTVGRAAEFA